MTAVVDASTILLWLQDETGSDAAEPLLMEALVGAANWSEVLQKVRQRGAHPELASRLLTSFGVRVADVTQQDAEAAALLWRADAPLSLADRLCLALGLRLGLQVATADRAWQSVPDGPEIILIR